MYLFYIQSRARNFPPKNRQKVGNLPELMKITWTHFISTISKIQENYHDARNFHYKLLSIYHFQHASELDILYTSSETHFEAYFSLLCKWIEMKWDWLENIIRLHLVFEKIVGKWRASGWLLHFAEKLENYANSWKLPAWKLRARDCN